MKFVLHAVLALVISSGTITAQTATPPAAGDGSSGAPYQIATLENLYWLSVSDSAWNDEFVQTAHINASASASWDGGNGFTPIGNATTKFTGTYNGGGYTVDSLFISRGTDYNGMFGYLNFADIRDLGVTNADITGNAYIGALAGEADGTTDVTRCYSSGNITASAYTAGGLIGYATTSAVVSNSMSSCDINGGNTCGGFIGSNAGTVSDCYCTGDVDGGNSVGGFTSFSNKLIIRCYSTGAVTATGAAGGFVVYGPSTLGTGAITDCFWDKTTSGESSSDGATGKTTAEMTDVATFTALVTSGLVNAWDFVGDPNNDFASNDYWHIDAGYNSGYPYLVWEIKTAPVVTTAAMSGITDTSAACGGDVASDGGAAVSAYGICWNTSGSPTVSDNVTDDGSGTGTFSSALTGLVPNTVYYVRAYATNSVGTTYGSEENFQAMPVSSVPAGAGTEGDPYQIASLGNLSWLMQNSGEWNKYYLQTADINAASCMDWDLNRGFIPIGNASAKFTGTYNGGGFAVDSLFIDRGTDYNGLFGYLYYADITDLGITNADITGNAYNGALAGKADGSTDITRCSGSGSLTATGNTTGGLVGYLTALAVVSNSMSSCDVNGSNTCGGFIGSCTGTVTDCYSTGDVDGATSVGGFTAYTSNSISRCYSTGAVTATGASGGFAAYGPGTLGSGVVTGCFWDKTTSGMTLSDGGAGKTTAEMTDVVTFTNTATAGLTLPWDFVGDPNNDVASSDLWHIDSTYNAGYPYLTWEVKTAPVVTTDAASGITDSSAVCGGDVTSDGGAAVTVRGVCWNTSGSPTTADNTTSDGTGTGTFVSALTGLSGNTVYYVRAYATNSEGTSYGAEVSFQTQPAQTMPAGAGTEGDPYLIASLDNLSWLMQHSGEWDNYYEQTADINAAVTAGWDNDSGFTPVGTPSVPFTGTYDGGGYAIDSLIIDRMTDYNGLFGYAAAAVFKGIEINDADIRGTAYIGGVAGYIKDTTLIMNCHTSGDLRAYNNVVGGISGYNNSGSSIMLSHSDCTVQGGHVAGGVVGTNYANIYNSYSTGGVTGLNSVGGFVGFTNGTVAMCYSTGSVSGTGVEGGFAGTGPLANGSGTVTDCFWDKTASGLTFSDGGTGKTTAEMKDVATFTNIATSGLSAAWDFVGNPNNDAGLNSYWNISGTVNGGYPYFAWTDGSDQTVPVITSAAKDTATEDVAFSYIATATDDDAVPSISFGTLPGWLTQYGDTLRGTPDDGDTDGKVTVYASDGELTDSLELDLTVTAVNDAPAAVSDAFSTAEESMLTEAYPGVLVNDTDADDINAGLMAYWNFDDILQNGQTYYDASGNGNNATLYNGAVSGAGKFAQGLSLAGDNDYAIVSNHSSLNPTAAITISAWVKPDDITTNTYYEIYRQDSGDNRKLFSFQGNGSLLTLGLNVGGGYAETDFAVDPAYFTDGNWHLVTYTYDGAEVVLYIDGYADTSTAWSGAIAGETAAVYLGCSSGAGEFFDGNMDDIGVWDRALIPGEVSVLYNRGTGRRIMDSRTVTVIDSTRYGTLTLDANGAFTYAPQVDFNGSDTLLYQVADAEGLADTGMVVLAVTPVNDAPVVTSAVKDTATEEQAFSYVATATDPDDTPAISYGVLPAWLTQSGDTISGTADDGDNNVKIMVYASDGEYTDSMEITVVVINVNDPPVLTSAAFDTATEEQQFIYTPDADDPDDGSTNYSYGALPSWLGEFGITVKGTPDDGDTDCSFWLYADDGELTDSLLVTVTVIQINDAPVLTGAAADTATELVEFTYVATVADPDDTPVISFGTIPWWMTQYGDTLRGTAPAGTRGDWPVMVYADDGEIIDSMVLGLAVKDGDGTVPVELSSFTASPAGGNVELAWTTQSEEDNFGYNVYRSDAVDGDFIQLNGALIPGAGTTSLPQAYSFTDTDVDAGMCYYRLEMVALDGTGSFSDVISVDATSRIVMPVDRNDSIGGIIRLYTLQGVPAAGNLVPGIYLLHKDGILLKVFVK